MCANIKVVKRSDSEEGRGGLTPFGHVMSLRDAMSRVFDESFWDPFEPAARFSMMRGSAGVMGFPKVDISETEDEVKVVADIPGMDPEKVEVEVSDDGIVTLSGKTEHESEEKDKRYHRIERSYGEFRREFMLPTKVQANKVTAKAKNGVLTLIMPKSEEERKKKVRIVSE